MCVDTYIAACVGECVRLYKYELFHVHVCPLECVCMCVHG